LVARFVRDEEAAGSNPVTPTSTALRIRAPGVGLFPSLAIIARPRRSTANQQARWHKSASGHGTVAGPVNPHGGSLASTPGYGTGPAYRPPPAEVVNTNSGDGYSS
jgi:hypothetical protein